MITVSNLNKFYSTRKSVQHALKDISLELPDKGLVFVLGKSGSGKSTLLNLISGLDTASSGQIVVDGNVISDFSEKEFVHYRNACIGFIFQDHHLIDDLTLYQNIKLVLDLRHIRDDSLISQALEQVGLKGYEERYPRELSGGERQRVAIARAIVKKPRIILADEPTGNLDGRNAAEVMRILRSLADDCLVLVVSHNTAEVQANAHRIIELSDGRVIRDQSRNPDYSEQAVLQGDTLYCPGDRVLDDTDVSVINGHLAGNRVKRFAIGKNKFCDTLLTPGEGRQMAIDRKGMGPIALAKLSFTFLKTKLSRIFAVAIPLSLIMLVILLSQAYINFDGNRIIADRMEQAGQQAIVLSKELAVDELDKNSVWYTAAVTQEDLQSFLDTGFEGKTYPILSVSVPITTYKNAAGIKTSRFSYGVAAAESLGTVVVDEDFFVEKLGALEFVALARNEDPLGLYITDYLADVILATNSNYKGKNYASLLGDYASQDPEAGAVYINGIIKTGYDTRYAELIDRVAVEKETDIAVLYNDEAFQQLSSELYSFLAYTYTFNSDYVSDYLSEELSQYHIAAWSHKLRFDGKTDYVIPSGYVSCDLDSGLTDGQVIMGYKMYNAVFGGGYNPDNLDTFVPHTAQLTQYAYHDAEGENPLFDTQIQIVGLCDGDGMWVSSGVRSLFDRNQIRQTGIYFDGLSHLSDILEVAEERGFVQDSITLEGILTLNRCVALFVFIFQMVNVVLCAAVVFIFVSFATKMIRDKLHEIGIMKALGTGRFAINAIFGLQIGLIAVITCLVSGLGYYFLIEPANDLFILSLREMVPSQLVLDLDVLVYIPEVMAENVALIAVLAVISLVVPMRRIGRIQPVQIINNRD